MGTKTLLFRILLIFSLSGLSFSLQAEESDGKLALKISGGPGYVEGGDINDFFLIMNNLYAMSSHNDKNFYYLHWGYEAQVELSYCLSSRWRIGICSGFAQVNGAPNKLIRNFTSADLSVTYHTRISLIPLEARLEFVALSSPKNSIYLHAGIGYSYSHWNNKKYYQYKQSNPSYYNSSIWEENAGATGFGLRFGIGYEQKLSGRLSLFAEGCGRLAKLAGFKGERVVYNPSSVRETGIRSTLYYYEWNWSEDLWSANLQIIGRPVGSGVRNAREAGVNFSGIGLMIGLLFHL